MKTFIAIFLILILSFFTKNLFAQNTFPATGRVGIYTTSPAASLQVKGGARFGTLTNYVNIDSATGNLSFAGTSGYQVGGNKYAFQYSGNANYGLFFNSSAVQYEFRNGSAVPVFSINANSGNSVFNGTLKVGAYTLPSTDGTSGQTLTTNGAGIVKWSTVSGGGSQWTTSGSNIYYNTGNVGIGTSTPTHLLEVTDDAQINGLTVGHGSGNVVGNTAFGTYALNTNTTGSNSTAIGLKALYSNTTGVNNTATGAVALYLNTTGFDNVANGNGALEANTTGFENTGIGYDALYSNTTGFSNTASGYGSLSANTTGSFNTANGVSALSSNTTGNYNTANGEAALGSNTTGTQNTSTGAAALSSNTTGFQNTSTGSVALYKNTTGSNNHSYGYNSLYNNTTGNGNIAIGSGALYSNATCSNQIAIGDSALYNSVLNNAFATESNIAVGSAALLTNTSGYDNTALGYQALYSNTSGAQNTAVGHLALHSNTFAQFNTAVGETTLYYNTGYANTALGYAALDFSTTASSNVAVGGFAMENNTTGYSNTASGSYSLINNLTGYQNAAFGDSAAFDDVSASYNTEIGKWAGYGVANGSNNTYVGYYTGPTIAGLTNCTALGNLATPTASNQVRLGSSAVTSIGGQVSYTTFSDGRFKKNIKQNVPGLAFINQLKPITYTLDIAGIKHFKGEDKKDNLDVTKAEDAKNEKTIHTGFIAQDVEAVAKKMSYDFDGVDAAQNNKDLYGLRYAEFVVPLVKAVQELSKQNDLLKAENERMNERMDKIEAMLSQQNNTVTSKISPSNVQSVILAATASLSQNVPNPFTNSTVISYYLPVSSSHASINFYSVTGTLLKSVTLPGSGNGNITLQANQLPSGVYRYTLVIDGKIIDSKQMILSK